MLFNFDRFFAPGQWGNIIRIRDGGLAVYGGIIASGLAYILYSRFKKIPLGNLLDAAGFGLFIGQAVGRWGNFINREAYGVETDLPWRMGLTSGGITRYVHPFFLYECLWNVAGLLIMHIFSKKSKTKYPGQYFLFYVAWYGLGRFMIEGLRTDSLMIWGTQLRASQWLAALSFLAAIGILIYNHIKGTKSIFVYSGDAGDAEDIGDAEGADDDTEELAELDGASKDDVSDESDDEKTKDDTEELSELDSASEEDTKKDSNDKDDDSNKETENKKEK